MERIRVGAAPIDVITAENAAIWVLDRMYRGVRTSEAGVNASFVVMAEGDLDYGKALEKFNLLLVDGFWVAAAATLLFRLRVPHANTGPFLQSLFKGSAPNGLKVFLLGARPEIVRIAAANLPQCLPHSTVVGYEHGYFGLEEEEGIVAKINDSGADVLLLGMASPKKEMFIKRNWNELKVYLSVGVGGFFDIWAGKTKEAPDFVRRYGFEWMYRLLQEPKRMGKRYTKGNLNFMLIVLKQSRDILFSRMRRPGVQPR
jgi:N-acetylglucosaminyldiphosphoundecaprenol N-acetyl-beta-D-mannosaminyltransferase